MSVAPSAALSETNSASRAPGLSSALPNQSSVNPGIGQVSVRRSLNA